MFGSSGKSPTLAAISSVGVHAWLRLCLAPLHQLLLVVISAV